MARNAYFTTEYLEDLKLSPSSNKIGRTGRTSRQGSPRSFSNRPSPKSTISKLDSIDPIEDPDELMLETTPAELNYLSRKPVQREQRQLVDYYNYYRPRRRPVSPTKRSGYSNTHDDSHIQPKNSLAEEKQSSMPGRGDFSGYYIDQKRKYDAAKEVKPACYTHKTFRDVFSKDSEERLNPIDIVFEDSAKLKEINDRRVISKALKKVQKSVGMDDYASYDYFEQIKKEEGEKDKTLQSSQKDEQLSRTRIKKLFGKKKTSSPNFNEMSKDTDSDTKDSQIDLSHDNALTQKENSRSRWFFSKRSKIYDEFRDDESTAFEEILSSKLEESLLPKESSPEPNSKDYIIEDSSKPVISSMSDVVGPNENFLPLWNSLLSWVVYERLEDPTQEESPANKIEELSESDHSLTVTKNEAQSKLFSAKSLLNAKKYKDVLSKWYDPASNYLGNPPKFLERRSKSTVLTSQTDNFLEFEVEFGDEDMADELLFNPETGQLKAITSSKSVQQSLQPLSPVSNGSATVMSSVNKLIKNIKIMRILFAPIDVIAENFPRLQTLVIVIELGIFIWILYELSLLIDALCMAIKAICAPMIAVGKFMNRIM